MKAALIALALGAGLISAPALAQPAGDGPHAHHLQIAQATTAPSPAPGQGQMPGMTGGPGQPGAGGMMPGMAGMGRGMMGMGRAMPEMMGGTAMHGPMLKVMFAIADLNGDGSLSFDEVTAIHKRMFDAIDANKDGKVTVEEMQAFFRE